MSGQTERAGADLWGSLLWYFWNKENMSTSTCRPVRWSHTASLLASFFFFLPFSPRLMFNAQGQTTWPSDSFKWHFVGWAGRKYIETLTQHNAFSIFLGTSCRTLKWTCGLFTGELPEVSPIAMALGEYPATSKANSVPLGGIVWFTSAETKKHMLSVVGSQLVAFSTHSLELPQPSRVMSTSWKHTIARTFSQCCCTRCGSWWFHWFVFW